MGGFTAKWRNASPDTYLTGQPLKANTFAVQQQPRLGASVLVFTPLLAFANKESSETMANQENPPGDIKGADFIFPPGGAAGMSAEPVARLTPRQAWEGTVIERRGSSFLARVTDHTNPFNPDELVTFDLDEISEEDRQMLSRVLRFIGR
jgi:hypothetical protein